MDGESVGVGDIGPTTIGPPSSSNTSVRKYRTATVAPPAKSNSTTHNTMYMHSFDPFRLFSLSSAVLLLRVLLFPEFDAPGLAATTAVAAWEVPLRFSLAAGGFLSGSCFWVFGLAD